MNMLPIGYTYWSSWSQDVESTDHRWRRYQYEVIEHVAARDDFTRKITLKSLVRCIGVEYADEKPEDAGAECAGW